MRCVPESVNKLFPELDLSLFTARSVGYGLCDIQRMIPSEYSVWPIYVNHIKCENFDILKTIPISFYGVPLFLFMQKHCIYSIWYRDKIEIFENSKHSVYDAELFFNRHKIYKVATIVRYADYKLLEII